MRTLLVLLASLIVDRSGATAADVTAAELLDEIIHKPGSWDQMCGFSPQVKKDVPLLAYASALHPNYNLSEENVKRLAARRGEIVAEMAARLEALDIAKPPVVPEKPKASKGDWPSFSAYDPKHLSNVLLQAIVHLNAVETIPGLLKVEAQLNDAEAKAVADPKAAIPALILDAASNYTGGLYTYTPIPGMPGSTRAGALNPRDVALLDVRIYQREILSVVTRLLRAEKYQPLLETEIEKRFIAAAEESLKEEGIADVRTREQAKQKAIDLDKPWLAKTPFDPISGKLSGYPGKVEIPYSPELRAQIRGLAERFLKEVPREKWLAEKAMPE